MEVAVTTGTALDVQNFQSNHHKHTQHLNFSTGCMSFLSPSQQCLSTEGEWNFWSIEAILAGAVVTVDGGRSDWELNSVQSPLSVTLTI